jgi:hypothetical protein
MSAVTQSPILPRSFGPTLKYAMQSPSGAFNSHGISWPGRSTLSSAKARSQDEMSSNAYVFMDVQDSISPLARHTPGTPLRIMFRIQNAITIVGDKSRFHQQPSPAR